MNLNRLWHTPEEYAFQSRCYAKYQYHWLLKHGYSMRDILEEFCKACDAHVQNCTPPRIINPEHFVEQWHASKPFEGECYVSFREFLANEWRDIDFMRTILPVDSDYKQYMFFITRQEQTP